MKSKVGDKVTVMMYHPNTDDYQPTQAVVEEVSQLQGYETVRCKHYDSHFGSAWYKVIDPTDPSPKAAPKNRMTNGQLAAKYGISPETLRERWADFVENEGYTEDGKEHGTFGDYLDYVYRLRIESREPFDGGRGAGSLGQQSD